MNDRARITIKEPNGVERSRPLTSRGLTIGRGAENNVALAYDLISRNHLQITYQNGRYYVTDLNSANGTYLGKNRLPPNQPIAWNPQQELRVGDIVISLEYAYTEALPPASTSHGGGDTLVGNVNEFLPKNPERQRRCSCLLLLAIVACIIFCTVSATVIYLFYFP